MIYILGCSHDQGSRGLDGGQLDAGAEEKSYEGGGKRKGTMCSRAKKPCLDGGQFDAGGDGVR